MEEIETQRRVSVTTTHATIYSVVRDLPSDKWVRPLEIRKLVDDNNPFVDLDQDMTVADVWVDKGRARAEGHDQHAAVRVIQKPAAHTPARFPSVEQDWDAAARSYETHKQKCRPASVGKFPAIPEESAEQSHLESTALGNHKAQPFPSVEDDDFQAPPTLADEKWVGSGHVNSDGEADAPVAPPHATRLESQELGDFPMQAQAQDQSQGPIPAENRKDESEYESVSEYETSSDETDAESSEGSTEYEEDATSEEESSEQEDDEASGKGEDHRDHDGDTKIDDVAIAGKSAAPTGRSLTADVDRSVSVDKDPPDGTTLLARLGKRKGVQNEDLPASKGPRLELSSSSVPANDNEDRSLNSKADVDQELIGRHSNRSQRSSPASSSAGTPDQINDRPDPNESNPGDGTPGPRSQRVSLPLANKPALSDEAVRRRSHIFGRTVSARTPKAHGELATQPSSSPEKAQSVSPEKRNSLPSALRKDTQNGHPSPRRSVSFADEQGLSLNSEPRVASTSRGTKARTKQDSSVSSSALRQRPADTISMVYPPHWSQEMVDKIVREAEEKYEKRDRQTREYEQRIKDAEEQNMDSEYVRQAHDILSTWTKFLKEEKSNRQDAARNARRLQGRLARQEKKLARMRARDRNKSSNASPSAEEAATREPASGELKEPSGAPEEADGEEASSAAQDRVSQSPNGISSQTRLTPKASSSAWPPITGPRPQRTEESLIGHSNPPQSIIKPDDVKLPSMSTVPLAREVSNQPEPTHANSSHSEVEDLPSLEGLLSSAKNASRPDNEGGTSRVTQVDALPPSSRTRSAPARATPASDTQMARANLKSLLNDQKRAKAASEQPRQVPGSSPPRRKFFRTSSPGSEYDSESDAHSESHSDSYADHGDITPSGDVQKLRSPRQRKEVYYGGMA